MNYLTLQAGHVLAVPGYGTLPETVHVFDSESIEAVNAALAARRPLLVRGEPGTGKSQLARAVAVALERAFLPYTVDARTEARDLLFEVDTVARLADAQILGHLAGEEAGDVRERLAENRYTKPGPIWWAFDWKSAEEQAETAGAPRPRTPGDPANGAVLLVDEIDKADPSVPNGLLEALGLGRFDAPGGASVATSKGSVPPLVLITTNEERALPDAFLRRCLVLYLAWPHDREALIEALVARGRAHFGGLAHEVLRLAAEMVADDRQAVQERGLSPPGGAEYLDLVRAVSVQWEAEDDQLEALERVRTFALRKHPEAISW